MTAGGPEWSAHRSSDQVDFPEVKGVNTVPVLQALVARGLVAESGEKLHSLLNVALIHDSYLHEHQSELTGITPGVLESLSTLGRAFVRRTAAVSEYSRRGFDQPGPLSDYVGQVNYNLPRWSHGLKWLAISGAFGESLAKTELPPRVTATIVRQVLGVLCLVGHRNVAKGLIADLLEITATELRRQLPDAWSRLRQELGDEPEIRFTVVGPDHAAKFTAVIIDSRARRSVGHGSTKKEARRNAALGFLQTHLRTTLRVQPSRARKPSRVIEGPGTYRHREVVSDLQHLFELPQGAGALLSQALIHPSWSYENRSLVVRMNQQDNGVLGLIGSTVLDFEHAFAAAQRALVERPREFTFQTLSSDTYESAFWDANLANALLLGAGQASVGISREMAANAFQATIAAVYLGKGAPLSILDSWPSEWDHIRRLVAPDSPRPKDPTTLFQELCSAAHLDAQYTFEASGPHHAQQHRATVQLNSRVLERQIAVRGPAARGKTPAKHEVANVILDLFDRLSDPQPTARLLVAQGPGRSIASFLLAHLLAVVSSSTVSTSRWIRARLLGAHLIETPETLIKWARQADRLRGMLSAPPDVDALVRLYRSARSLSQSESDPVTQQLATTLDWLDQIDGPGQVDDSGLQTVTQLCTIYRALGLEGPGTTLKLLVDDWRLLYRDRLRVLSDLPDRAISGRERSALDCALAALLGSRESVDVRAEIGPPFELSLSAEPPGDDAALGTLCTLLSQVAPTLSLTNIDGSTIRGVLTTISAGSGDGPIAHAVVAAMHAPPMPYGGAIADLLHDLKNQLIAARNALMAEVGGRTADLERQLSASRHLDQAVALGRRLRTASSLLGSPGAEPTELGAFIRRYASARLGQLPRSVSLLVPSAGSPVTVALDEPSLTAILDNLIKNAIEAMPNGGDIHLDWIADDQAVVLEVGDNGPGLPVDVLSALNGGAPIISRKPGGNGLGLAGVRTLLRRVGGELTAVPNSSGTTLLLTIPVAPSEVNDTKDQ